MRRRMLLSQQKKSSNLFNEGLLLKNTTTVSKLDNGYLIGGYPSNYSATSEIIQYFKSVLKANVDYTLAFNTITKGSGSSGAFVIRNSSGIIFIVG